MPFLTPHQRVPIIFISHSFRGIIIKEVKKHPKLAVCPDLTPPEALCKPSSLAESITDDTDGIFFLGTPHLGSPVSLVGAVTAFLTSFLRSNTTLLLALRTNQQRLSDLEDRFIERMKEKERGRKRTEIVSFSETKPTCLPRGLSISLVSVSTMYFNICLTSSKVVARDSARGGHTPKTIDVNTNHSGLNKGRRGDALHHKLTKELRRLKP